VWDEEQRAAIDAYFATLADDQNRAAFRRLEELKVLDDKVAWEREASRRMADVKRRWMT
jgi:hypothetical protein